MRTGECRSGCGACCEAVILNINPAYMEPDKKRWLELHSGIRLFRQDGGVWAWVQVPCKHLTAEKECGVFGLPERPQTCVDFPAVQTDIALLESNFGAGVCSYSFEEVAV